MFQFYLEEKHLFRLDQIQFICHLVPPWSTVSYMPASLI